MKKQDDIINNIIVALAVILMITICAGIYVVTSYLEAVNY